MSGTMIEGAFALAVVIATGIGAYFAIRFGNPLATAKEYINWYKVGRVKQYANEHQIDIDKVIAYEECRQDKKIVKSWTEKIEDELSKDLKDVQELEEKKK